MSRLVAAELLTPSEMSEADRLTIAAGTPGIVLMENAGRAVAEVVARRDPPGSRVVVVAGTGNNGGDGFVAARRLAAGGYRVEVALVGAPERLAGDAAEAARRWDGPTRPADPDALAGALAGAHVIVDALFGAGLDRPVTGLPAAVIEAMNRAGEAGAAVVAVDLPSGIDGASGAVLGRAVQASDTVTFFRAKPGHHLLPGRAHRGRLTIADIGIPADVLTTIAPRTWLNGPDLWGHRLPRPGLGGHKYTRGHAVVVCGPRTSTGAARLAARAALRAGAGLVTIASPADALDVNAATNLAVMVRPVEGASALRDLLSDDRFTAVVLGPGLGVGAATCDLVRVALDGPRAVVLDADALTSFAGDAESLFGAIRSRPARATILTPHEGEFTRLFGMLHEVTDAGSKLKRARAAARLSGAAVVLKGADTTIAGLDGAAVVNANAPPWLATAGAGDVLAGLVAGLAAQGAPGFDAAGAAVWMHGEAAIAAGPGLVADDLPGQLPEVLRRLWGESDAPRSTTGEE